MKTDDINTMELDIDESDAKYAIDKLDPGSDEASSVWTKHQHIFDEWRNFWVPRNAVAKKCQKYMRREIFTPGQRKKYMNVDQKIPIEPQEVKPIVNRLTKAIIDTAPTGGIQIEDDDYKPTVAQPEVVGVVLKWLQSKLKINQKREEALREGLITGMPQWLWFDKEVGIDGALGKLAATLLSWDQSICPPYFEEKDGSDIKDVFIFSWHTKGELLKLYPEREDALKKHEGLIADDPGYLAGALKSYIADSDSDSRADMYYELLSSGKNCDRDGRYMLIEHHYPIRREIEVYVNEDTYDVQQIPGHWDKFRKKMWVQEHPQYQKVTTDYIDTAWVTSFGIDGFIWENDASWYQDDGALPGVCFIADMVDKIPTGSVEDMLPYVLAIACCDTEDLADVRSGSRTLTMVMEGSIRNPAGLNHELTAPNGVVAIKRNSPAGMDSIRTDQRTPSKAYGEQANVYRAQLQMVHGVNDAMMGRTHQRKSGVVQSVDMEQGVNTQAIFVNNYRSFTNRITQLLCNFFPYCLTEQTVIEIDDEYGRKQDPTVVNQQGYDYSGQAYTIANDLTQVKYHIIPTINEDSPSQRQQDMKDFVGIIESIGNSILKEPQIAAGLLSAFPNRYAREASAYMKQISEQQQMQQQQAQQAELESKQAISQQRGAVEMERLKRPDVKFTVDPKGVQEAPQGAQVMMQILAGMNAQQQAGPGEQAPQQQAGPGEPAPQQQA